MNTLTAKIRDNRVKAKSIRNTGYVPGCIYGSHLPEPILIQVEQHEAASLLKQKSQGCVVNIVLEDKSIAVLIKDVSRNALKNEIEHIDFQALDGDRKVSSSAKVIIRNKEIIPGYIIQTMYEIPYESLPSDIVESVIIDLTGIPAGGRITVGDLDISKNGNIQLLASPESIVLTIKDTRKASCGTPRDDS